MFIVVQVLIGAGVGVVVDGVDGVVDGVVVPVVDVDTGVVISLGIGRAYHRRVSHLLNSSNCFDLLQESDKIF